MCMAISAVGFVYLLFIGILISCDSVSVEHMHPADGSSAAFYLASFVYLIIFAVLAYMKYGTKTQEVSIEQYIKEQGQKNQEYVPLNEMSSIATNKKPQEVL